jgi:hypothetical protein
MPNRKSKVGRPLLFKTAEELQAKINEYFDWCDNRARAVYDKTSGQEIMINHPAPYTMSGLARRLGIDRQTLINYSKRDEFFGTIREARNRVHEDVETRMMETKNERGAMFSLRNNFNWKDKTETDVTSGGKPIPILGGIAKTNKDE